MSPETLYLLTAVLGAGLICLGVAVFGLDRKVRALEAKLQDVPRRFQTEVRMPEPTAEWLEQFRKSVRETKLPRGQ